MLEDKTSNESKVKKKKEKSYMQTDKIFKTKVDKEV
jgi:hypothetical protein